MRSPSSTAMSSAQSNRSPACDERTSPARVLDLSEQVVRLRRVGFPPQGVERSVLIPPVHVGPRCAIENSIVGPHVSMAEGVTIRDAVLRARRRL